jgi:hypothetical protein
MSRIGNLGQQPPALPRVRPISQTRSMSQPRQSRGLPVTYSYITLLTVWSLFLHLEFRLGDDLLLDIGRHDVVMGEFHRITALAAGH